MNLKKKVFVIFLAASLVLSVSVYLVYAGYEVWKQAQANQKLLEKRSAAWKELKNSLANKARLFHGDAGIIIEDLNTGWQFSLNKDKLFPSASIVKIPIMAACFQAASEGRLNLNDEMVLRGANKTSGSGILKSAATGTAIPIEKLIDIMITNSDNTAANMLIEKLGFDYLNGYFKKSGLRHTNLSRKMMDFEDRKYGVENYTSASDISDLLEKFYHRKFINRQISEKCLAMLLRQKVNDRIPKKLPDDCPVAHKTGLEKNVCHDAGIVFTQQGDFLICVLTKSRSGTRQVKEFISNLALVIYRTYRQFPYSRYSLLNNGRILD
ncbi:MAG: class A beta-lactamase-related serine hydrolase [Candidatus Omnitrophica bacterium]|nr:class A beta-lactamase-related serine hydrolase [Candidatus Omnitrophota bacterium]